MLGLAGEPVKTCTSPRPSNWRERQLKEHTYGINTGFGCFVERSILFELSQELQLRLLRSHACGVGEPYPHEVVRAAMPPGRNALAKGCPGARPEVVELLLECVNRDVVPVVPSRGSVGASGDLAPLAHLALPLVGEGRAVVDGEELERADALARAGLEPVRLHARRHFSLINVTQFMAAVGAPASAPGVAKTADIACALSVEALQASRVSLPEVHVLRPLPGHARGGRQRPPTARRIGGHRGAPLRTRCRTRTRCAARQVHGASRAFLEYAERTIAIELNAATDNPLVFAEQDELMSNGNFHGQPSRSRSTRSRWRSPSSRPSRSGASSDS